VKVPALPQFVVKVEADTVKVQLMDCPFSLSAISDCPSVLQPPEPAWPGPVHVKVPPWRKAQTAKLGFTRCPFTEVALHFPKKAAGIGVGVGVMGATVRVGVGLDRVGVGVGGWFPEGVRVGVGLTVLVGVGVGRSATVGVGGGFRGEIRLYLTIPSPPPHCVVSVVTVTAKLQMDAWPAPKRIWVESTMAHVLWMGAGTPAPRQTYVWFGKYRQVIAPGDAGDPFCDTSCHLPINWAAHRMKLRVV
jgi:hypothetical protein